MIAIKSRCGKTPHGDNFLERVIYGICNRSCVNGELLHPSDFGFADINNI